MTDSKFMLQWVSSRYNNPFIPRALLDALAALAAYQCETCVDWEPEEQSQCVDENCQRHQRTLRKFRKATEMDRKRTAASVPYRTE